MTRARWIREQEAPEAANLVMSLLPRLRLLSLPRAFRDRDGASISLFADTTRCYRSTVKSWAERSNFALNFATTKHEGDLGLMVGAINTKAVPTSNFTSTELQRINPLTPEQEKQLSGLLHTFMRLNHKQNRVVDENGYPQTLSNFALEAHCSDVPFSLPVTVGNEVDFHHWQTWVSVWNDAVRSRQAQAAADHQAGLKAVTPQVSVTGGTMTMASLVRLFGKQS